MFTTMGRFTLGVLLLCICSTGTVQAGPIGSDAALPARNARDARSFFPFGLGGPDHVHYYPEQHHHHHFDEYAHSGFPGHHDSHYHLDVIPNHQHQHHHHHHDVHEGHFDHHYY